MNGTVEGLVERVVKAIAEAPSYNGMTLDEELSERELRDAARAAIRATDVLSLQSQLVVSREALERVTNAADNLAGELFDPGTEALAAIHCARAALTIGVGD